MSVCVEAKESVTPLICGPGSPHVIQDHHTFDVTKLPKQIQNPLLELSRRIGFSTSSLLAPMFTVAGAGLGNGFVLETELFPGSLNACLDCGLIGDTMGAEWVAELITQPLREEQDRRIAASANTTAKVLRKRIRDIEAEKERFFGNALMRDPAAESSFDSRIQALHDQLYPVLIVEDPAPGCAHDAAIRSGGNGVLVSYGDAMMQILIKARKKGSLDFVLLGRAQHNKSHEGGVLENHNTSLVRPAVSCLIRCSEQSMSNLLCSPQPAVAQFVDQLIIAFPANSMSTTCGSVPDSWRLLLTDLLVHRGPSGSRTLTLSPSASALLVQYARDLGVHGQPGRLSRQAAMLVGKIALILHAISSTSAHEIPAATVIAAIAVAEAIIKQTTAAANRCVSSHGTSGLTAKAARLFQKIQTRPPISERELQRRTNMRADELRLVVEHLVQLGQVRYRPEDHLIESLHAQQQAGN